MPRIERHEAGIRVRTAGSRRVPVDGGAFGALARFGEQLMASGRDALVQDAKDAERERRLKEANWEQAKATQVSETLELRLDEGIAAGEHEEAGFAERWREWANDEMERRLSEGADGEQEAFVGDGARDALRGRLTTFASRKYLAALEAERDAQRARGMEALDALERRAAARARTMLADPEERADPAARLAEFDAAIGVYEKAVPPAILREARERGRVAVLRATVRGSLDGGRFDDARRVLSDPAYFTDLPPDTRNTLMAELEAEHRRERAGALSAARSRVEDISVVLRAGARPADDALEQAQADAATFPELREELAEARSLGGYMSELRRQPVHVVQQVLNDLHGAPTKTAADVRRIEAVERLASEARRELARDPLSYAASAGVVEVGAFDPNDAAAMTARLRAAKVAEAAYGVPVPLATQDEMEAMARRWRGAAAAERTEMLRAVEELPVPSTDRALLLDHIAEKAPGLGLVANLSARAPETARRVLLGGDVLRNNPDLGPARADYAGLVDDYLGNALIADATGEGRGALLAAALAYYAQGRTAPASGLLSGGGASDFDADAFEDALAAVGGAVARRNGQDYFLPPEMDEDDFEARLAALTDADLHPTLGRLDVPSPGPHRLTPAGLARVTADELRDDARLVTLAPGLYLVAFGDDGALGYAVGADGEPFRLDMRR